jgi:SPP1 gp7 family putative phage head morphogenesis protein
MAEFLIQPTPHEEAAAFLRNKPAVSRGVFDKLVPELKARAFTIAGIEGLGVLTSVRDTIATLPEGGDWETLKKQIVSDIDPFFVDPEADAETQSKQRYAAERRAELLLRTHGQQAYAAAAWREADEQRDLFPFWKYQTLGDGNVRPSHAALDGIVLPHDDPFWATHTPPWDWGCRCQFIPLSDADVAEIQDADRGKPPEQRSILDEADRKKLNDERVIYRPSNLATGTGHPVPYSVASPAERGKPNAYTFRPGDLRLDAAAIQSRHDPKDWAQFEQWAKKQQLPGQGKSVWEWMNGATPLPKAEIPPAPAPAPEKWPELSTLKKVGKLGGSTGAELWQSADGRKFVLKRGASAEHLREEVAADTLYQALGVPVPDHKLYETPEGPVKLAQFIEGKPLSAATLAKHRDEIAQHFAADALLGNWDAIGLSHDNMIVDGAGKIWRIDNGGSLRFRAMGKIKTAEEWNEFPRELWTLRDAKQNASAAAAFGHLGIHDIAGQIGKLDSAALAAAPEELRAVLEARLGHMRDVSRKALEMQADNWQEGYTDDLTRHMIGLRAEGLVAAMPKQLAGAAGDVVVKDENGLMFDHLRTHRPDAAKKTAKVIFHEPIESAAKTVNFHHSKGDTAYNQAKITEAESHRPALLKLVESGTKAEQKLAQHYLESLDAIKEAQGDAKKTVPLVKEYKLPKKTKGKAEPIDEGSLVKRLSDYIEKEGGDWKHVAHWAGQQAGSSQSAAASAYKYFLFENLDGAKPGDFFRNPSKAAFESLVPAAEREAYRKTMMAHHAFIQELLGKTGFEGNDTERRKLRVLRTESKSTAVPFAIGQKGQYKRGVNESGSIFRPVFSGARTITNVPHSRVTSLYFLERTPGGGSSFLLGDGENESTYIAHGLDTIHVKRDYHNTAPGTDSTKWEI